MRIIQSSLFFLISFHLCAQGLMTPELLWSLGRVNGELVSKDGQTVYYTVSRYDQLSNKSTTSLFAVDLKSGQSNLISDAKTYAGNACFDGAGNLIYSKDGAIYHDLLQRKLNLEDLEYSNLLPSPNGRWMAFSRSVKVDETKSDLYPELDKSPALIYDDLIFRHWKDWEDGYRNHIFIAKMDPDGMQRETDIMPREAFDSPTMPSGGLDDMAWSSDSKYLAYVCVKKRGKEYAVSTNSDIYMYDLASGKTSNITQGLNGYDRQPLFSPDGRYLAWLSMEHDGYESDKNNIVILDLISQKQFVITKNWDETVNSFIWSSDSKNLYANVPYRGTIQLFRIEMPGSLESGEHARFKQISKTEHDYNAIVGISGKELICMRTDFNHAAEIFAVHIETGEARQISQVNTEAYSHIQMSPVQKHWIKTSDGQSMLTWVIYPPQFDSTKKYPTLLYCQGGPQSALSQFYSFRWNFQLMAANGYIIVAPNRRGMPGWGSKWNAQISGDWGGQCMKDYLSAIDQVSLKPYVDVNRRACVGASFGGYSVFMLAGIHKGRFKSFISHCGTFNLESWYGSTEELWFANWDLKGPYWDKKFSKSYDKFSPHKYVQNWDSPILIIQGGRDYRIPDTQAFEAFTAARLRNIKSRLLYFPDEGHHILKIQNGLLWQKEYFRWLRETL